MKFRKKPIVIEAIPCRDAMRAFASDWSSLPPWLAVAYDRGGVVATDRGIYLPTLEGSMLAGPDDWIICGVKGEVYPCKPDIFAATYEPAAETITVNVGPGIVVTPRELTDAISTVATWKDEP